MNVYRISRIILSYGKSIGLDLSNEVVLTELGTNNYLFLPFIASMMGAKKVYALAKDNSYGFGEEVINQAKTLCDYFNLKNIVFLNNELPDFVFEDTTIVTNSGNLRPLNAQLLKKFKQNICIPLMFEAWEIREGDLDLAYCKENAIKVAGTWEHHADLDVFKYCGLLGLKLAFEAGFEISGNNILIYSDDDFGETIYAAFKTLGANVSLVHDFPSSEELKNTDFVFLCRYNETRNYFADSNGLIDWQSIKKSNPDLCYIHLYGNINFEFCYQHQVHVYPKKNGYAKVMSQTLGYVGLEPILRLQSAGLKVAMEMKHNKLSTLSQPISGFN